MCCKSPGKTLAAKKKTQEKPKKVKKEKSKTFSYDSIFHSKRQFRKKILRDDLSKRCLRRLRRFRGKKSKD